MKKILITGGAGFIGSNVVRHFVHNYTNYHIFNLQKQTNSDYLSDLKSKFNYSLIEGDITNSIYLDQIFKKHNYNAIIHLGEESGSEFSQPGPLDFSVANVIGTVNLLNAAKNNWFGNYESHRFYQVSTDILGPIRSFSNEDIQRQSADTKIIADQLVNSFHEKYGLNTVISNYSRQSETFKIPEKLLSEVISNLGDGHRKVTEKFNLAFNKQQLVEDYAKAVDIIFHQAKSGFTYDIIEINKFSENNPITILCTNLEINSEDERSIYFISNGEVQNYYPKDLTNIQFEKAKVFRGLN